MTSEMVSVIIVNYNGKAVLEKCVQSVFQSSYSPLEVLIVDNSPNDGTVSEVLKTFSVKLIKNNRNLGFAYGNNQGLKAAKGEYILLLNNDATLDPRAIEGTSERKQEEELMRGAAGLRRQLPNQRRPGRPSRPSDETRPSENNS